VLVQQPEKGPRRPPPLWFVTNGETTVGPVRTDLLQRGIRHGRIPEDCRVRELTWRTWRRLDQVREVCAVLRELTLAGGFRDREQIVAREELVQRLDRASDASEVLAFALGECCSRTGASFGLVHRSWTGRAEPITGVVRGLGMTARLGRGIAEDDESLALARVGGLVVGPPAGGRVERAIAQRLGAPIDLAGVAMVPLMAGPHLFGVIELGRVGHAFRQSDGRVLSEVADATMHALARK